MRSMKPYQDTVTDGWSLLTLLNVNGASQDIPHCGGRESTDRRSTSELIDATEPFKKDDRGSDTTSLETVSQPQ